MMILHNYMSIYMFFKSDIDEALLQRKGNLQDLLATTEPQFCNAKDVSTHGLEKIFLGFLAGMLMSFILVGIGLCAVKR